MKISVYTLLFMPVAERAVLDLLSKKHEVTFYIPDHVELEWIKTEEETRWFRKEKKDNISRLWTPPFQKILANKYLRNVIWRSFLAEIEALPVTLPITLLRERPDVLFSFETFYLGSFICALTARIIRRPLIILQHELNPYRVPTLSMKRFVLDNTCYFIVQTGKQLMTLSKEGVPHQKIVKLPVPVDVHKFSPRIIAYPRSKYKIDEDADVILFVGRLVWVKGVQYLIQAMKKIQTRIPKAVLVITGSGPYEENLKEMVRKMDLDDRVVFTGAIPWEKIEHIHMIADVFVLPSLIEQEGQVLEEVMACGKPVVASNVGGIPYRISHGVNGLLVPPKDPAKLADSIMRVLSDEKLAERLGETGRSMVEQNNSYERLSKLYEELFNRAVEDYRE